MAACGRICRGPFQKPIVSESLNAVPRDLVFCCGGLIVVGSAHRAGHIGCGAFTRSSWSLNGAFSVPFLPSEMGKAREKAAQHEPL